MFMSAEEGKLSALVFVCTLALNSSAEAEVFSVKTDLKCGFRMFALPPRYVSD